MTTVAENVFPQVIHSILTAHPSPPPAGEVLHYRLDTGDWYEQDSAGTKTIISGGVAPPNLADQDPLWTALGSPNATYSDEFDDASLHADWTQVDAAGHDAHLTWQEAGGLLSLFHDASADSPNYQHHGLMRSLGALTFPITIQTAFRYMARSLISYTMFGLTFSDGVSHGAGNQVFAWMFHSSVRQAINPSIRNYTNWGTQGATTDPAFEPLAVGHTHIRLRYHAANTYAMDISPDGVSWHELASAHASAAFTPTHFGFNFTNFNTSNTAAMISIPYFRVYESNPTPPA